MPGRASMTVFQFLPIFYTIFWLRSGVYHIFRLGKSKTRIKKELKQITLLHRISLTGFLLKTEYHTSTARALCIVYWWYIIAAAFSSIVWLLSSFFPGIIRISWLCTLVRIIVFDISINIYAFVMTKHGKNGGVTWRWTTSN